MMREIMKAQQRLQKLQEELEQSQFSGSAGGGAITVTMKGNYEITAIKIDPEAVNPEDIGELEAMLLAAAKDAFSKVAEAQQKMVNSITGGIKIPGLF
ncbi:YbaB/EbfC family nucleoid-associated protein [Thermogemmatispora sp.]|jgi:DNA-binding YbaB/EbfC family protein|uniref:YbaB/EbfC family nucleoid-associated protein n=1 Tax=Thermogemmatispora sp. TaxID=1968838 RepID=UPI0035E3F9BF